MRPWLIAVLLLGLCLPSGAQPIPCAPAKPVLKAIESVVLMGEPHTRVQARVDTGATLSSLDSGLAQRLGLDKYPVREILVRNAHGVSRRKVVKLKFVLKGQMREGEFTLIPRDSLSFPVLLGRLSLKGFWVDPGEE